MTIRKKPTGSIKIKSFNSFKIMLPEVGKPDENKVQELVSALVAIDQDNNGYITLEELAHVPIIRAAIALNEPDLLRPYDMNSKYT